MRYVMIGLCFLALAGSVNAVDRSELDARLRKLELKFDALQAKPDKRVPAQLLRQAHGMILLDRTKAGFIFAYQGGSGVVMVKDPATQRWSAPAFLSANEASLGFQIGGQQTFVVILLMHTNAIQNLAEGNFSFGGEASGTAGNNSSGVEGGVSSSEPLSVVYTDREGLYGGAAIKGDAIAPDTDANLAYYGQYFSLNDILFGHKAGTTPAGEELARKFDEYSK